MNCTLYGFHRPVSQVWDTFRFLYAGRCNKQIESNPRMSLCVITCRKVELKTDSAILECRLYNSPCLTSQRNC